VVITATATLQGWRLLRTGMQLGAREFLTKPFDDAEVRQTVRTATQSERFEASSLSA
jgi:FixJ family two-component response regulator